MDNKFIKLKDEIRDIALSYQWKRLYLIQDRPSDNLKKFIDKYGGNSIKHINKNNFYYEKLDFSTEDLIIIIDTTLFGGGEEGIFITDKRIIIKDSFSEPVAYKFSDIFSLYAEKDNLYINNLKAITITMASNKNAPQFFYEILHLIQNSVVINYDKSVVIPQAAKSQKTEILGITESSIESAQNYADNVILGASRGHGFAAEKANHLYDVFSGKNAKIVGGNNAKDGPDRLVNGINIQTKYCHSGSKCISECFESGRFRYLNADSSPMLIEVPADKYDDAVKAMAHRIEKGQVPGVSNPKAATEIVKKGVFTYEQVRNIARFGTIESLTYDAVNGIKLTGTSMGISASVSFAVGIWNGEKWDKALQDACYVGLKIGGLSWISSIITAQLGRTGVEAGLRGVSDWVVKQMGSKAAALIANSLRSGNAIYGAAAMNNVSKLLRGNFVTGAVTTLVLSSADFVRLFRGKCSGAQLFKNMVSTASGVAGGTAGWMGGAAVGAAIGSFIPIIGSAAGGVIGGITGALAGGSAANSLADNVLDKFIEDDAKKMLLIVEKEFGKLAFDYLLNEEQAESVIDTFKSEDIPDFLRDMFASNNREEFVQNKFRPIIEKIVQNRQIIYLPTDEQLIKETGYLIEHLSDTKE